jgi:hypothetical protein
MSKMSRNSVLTGLLVAVLGVAGRADEKREQACNCDSVAKAATVEGAKNAGLEKMKSLAGTWIVADQDGQPTEQVASVVKVTAGGSAVHETLFPGQPHEMVSIYTAEGPDLVMTHYCMLGNQPRMKAGPKSVTGNKISFEFAGGGNLDPAKDKHMHAATLTIVDADHIQIDGVGWETGAPMKEMCGQMKLVRKK